MKYLLLIHGNEAAMLAASKQETSRMAAYAATIRLVSCLLAASIAASLP